MATDNKGLGHTNDDIQSYRCRPGHPDADSNIDTNAVSFTNAVADSHTDADANTDTNANTYSDTNACVRARQRDPRWRI